MVKFILRQFGAKTASPMFFALVAAFVFCCASDVAAQDNAWAKKMFEVSEHNFRTVARGSEVKYRFKIYNRYKEEVHIYDVRTTCGCTAAEPSKKTLASGESAYIEITMDTERFVRQKDSNLIVTFDKPLYTQVTIPISAYIRSDVVIEPGSVNFGTVAKGKSSSKKISVFYAGRENWRIKRLIIKNSHLKGTFKETNRGDGEVEYEFVVSLDENTPAGNFRERILIETDDADSSYVPVVVKGSVEADVTVTVSSLGTLQAGSKKTFNVVLRGRKSFKISKIECESTNRDFQVKLSKKSKIVHVLPITFTSPKQTGRFLEKFTVTIDGRKEPVTFEVVGRIVDHSFE